MRRSGKWACLIGLWWIAVLYGGPAAAQDEVFISLSTETTTLQTGEFYEVQVLVENVRDLWLTSFEISYDPEQLYVVGTTSGTPVEAGPLLADADTLVPRNRVERGRILYTVSLLAPAEPINGSGVIAAFRVVPLAAGSAQLVFRDANLTSVTFQDSAGQSVAGEPQDLAFTPVLLDLTIQGDAVTPPPEFTATPPPTSTPINEITEEPSTTAEADATLVNITRVPADQPTNVPPAVTADSGPPVRSIVIAMLAISGLALLLMAIVYVRRYRR